jgi:hypothetical protein
MVNQGKGGGDMHIPPPGIEMGQLAKKIGVEREMDGWMDG